MAVHFADLFEHAADAVPGRTAVVCEDRQLTYRELDERSSRLAHHLASLGVGPGGHVGLYARNSVETVETLLAAVKLRAAAVNINYRYVEGELRYMFADADLVALVHDQELTPIVEAARDAAPTLCGTVAIGGDYDKVLADASPERDFGPRSQDDVYIIYTGGTTGHPKGVMWRHEDIWRTLGGGTDFLTGEELPDEWAQSEIAAETDGLVHLCIAPLIHGNAQVATLSSLFVGGTVVLVPKFDPVKVWQAVERNQVSVLVLTGDAMARPLIEVFETGDFDAQSIAYVSSSAALFSPVVKEAWANALPNAMISEAIGSTETGFAGIGFVTKGEAAYSAITVKPGPDVVVVDDSGELCGHGQPGWLARGGHTSLGYYKDPVKTAGLFAEVGGKRYVMSGDMARLEEDGSITLLGRGNTSVNTGGEKVYPEEVEGALKSHPDIADAVVIGVPDDRLGERVAAVIQPRKGCAGLDLAAVDSHVRTRIAGYKVPRTIWVAESLSRTVSGKVDYNWVRQYVSTHEAAK